jgi:hypothetical protein
VLGSIPAGVQRFAYNEALHALDEKIAGIRRYALTILAVDLKTGVRPFKEAPS